MKIDFVRTKRELAQMLQGCVTRLGSEHPEVAIKRIGIWALAFPKVAKVLVETENDDAVFGPEGPEACEYVPNEYDGIDFKPWWPDLYALEEGDRYEITLEKDWGIDPDLLQGDDAINLPLFALVKSVVEGVSLKGLKLTKDFQLSAEIGSHWLEARWRPGDSPKTSKLIEYLDTERKASQAGLRPRIPTTPDAFKCRLRTMEVGYTTVNTVAFLPDGKNLVSYADNSIRIWSVKSTTLVREIECDQLHHSLALSSDGKLGATFGLQMSIGLWNLDSGEAITELKAGNGPYTWAAFSPDGKLLVSGSWLGEILLWNVSTAKPLATLAPQLKALWQAKFSPDGHLVAWVCNGGDRSVVLYDVESRREFAVPVKHNPWPITVAFSPDGQLLATGGPDKINIWNIPQRRLERTLELNSGLSHCLAFSPDGTILVGGGEDRAFALWNISTGECLRTVANPGEHVTVRWLAFATHGRILASSNSDGTVELWDMQCLTRTD